MERVVAVGECLFELSVHAEPSRVAVSEPVARVVLSLPTGRARRRFSG
jgi:hypothetical protein